MPTELWDGSLTHIIPIYFFIQSALPKTIAVKNHVSFAQMDLVRGTRVPVLNSAELMFAVHPGVLEAAQSINLFIKNTSWVFSSTSATSP